MFKKKKKKNWKFAEVQTFLICNRKISFAIFASTNWIPEISPLLLSALGSDYSQ